MLSRSVYERKVLIGFVTKSDPESSRGLASIATALKALVPNVVYLLYTDETVNNYSRLETWIRSQEDLVNVVVGKTKPLELPDVTNYEALYEVLVAELKRIETLHQQARFHLVSGLAQARIIFALCVNARLPFDATLYEVNTPADQPAPSSQEGWRARLEEWPTLIFENFRQLYEERTTQKRLDIRLPECTVYLDEMQLDLRQRDKAAKAARGFMFILLLAARKRFGEGQSTLSKDLFERLWFDDKDRAEQRIPETIQRINAQAWKTNPDIIELIVRPESAKRRGGEYQLSDEFGPLGEAIKLPAPQQLKHFLKDAFRDHIEELAALFPRLELGR